MVSTTCSPKNTSADVKRMSKLYPLAIVFRFYSQDGGNAKGMAGVQRHQVRPALEQQAVAAIADLVAWKDPAVRIADALQMAKLSSSKGAKSAFMRRRDQTGGIVKAVLVAQRGEAIGTPKTGTASPE